MLGLLTVGGLLLVIPSVGNAQARARSFDRAHHAPYPGPRVPARFAAAITATEDHRFWSEPGVDPLAVGRLALGKVTGRVDQGGATLYQQLAKMLYTPGQGGFAVEAEQVGLGVKLRFSYSRQQILRMYADVAYYGHGFYGLRDASCGYFSVPPGRLSWPQAAMLAGAVQAPTLYDPYAHYSSARARESHVLGRLAATGHLSWPQAKAAYAQSLRLSPGGGHCAAA